MAGAVAAADLDVADVRVLSSGLGDADRSPSVGSAEESLDDETPADRLGSLFGALAAGTRLAGAEDEAAAGAAVDEGAAEAAVDDGDADAAGAGGAEGMADVASVPEPDAGGEGSSSLSRNTKPATTRISTTAPVIHDFAFQLLSIVGLSMRPPIPTLCGVKPARRAAGVPS